MEERRVYLLGLDVGTTACKAVLFDIEANKIADARAEYPLHYPKGGWAEINPNEIWEAVIFCIRDITRNCDGKIAALSVSSQGEGVMPLNVEGNPLGSVIVSFDRRSLEETEELKNKFGSKYFFKTSGQILSSAGTVTKIMWMEKHLSFPQESYIYACVGDFVTMRLSGKRVIDYSLAARTMMFDIHKKQWNQRLLTYIGIKKYRLSKPVQGGTPIGKVLKGIVQETGLDENTLVISGGHDQPMALLGTGGLKPGEVSYSLGTTETLVCNMERFNKKLYRFGLPCYPHVLKDQYITLPGNFTGGNLLQWYKNTFAGKERDLAEERNQNVYDILMEQMADRPSDLLVLPHFTMTGSPWNDPKSCGVIAGLQLSTTKGEYIRALQEGVTFEILLNVKILDKIGIKIGQLKVIGGGTKSQKLMQLKADVLGIPLSIPENMEAACKGAAFLAGCGCGMLSIKKNHWFGEEKKVCFKPDSEKHGQYLANLIKYKKMYAAQKKILRR